jgi:hypothetical protein
VYVELGGRRATSGGRDTNMRESTWQLCVIKQTVAETGRRRRIFLSYVFEDFKRSHPTPAGSRIL